MMHVTVEGLCKSFGRFPAVRDVHFQIRQGQLVGLLGPSGSGKTTVLRMLAGLEVPDAGDIKFHGQRVNHLTPQERGIGLVFQNYALFRHMTVYENIAFGLKVQKRSKAEIERRVEELLERTGLTGLARRLPHQLSGGQRQRVAFARALAPEPQLLLLDEPFAAIDAKVRKELRAWLKSMIREVGITSIFVTHDQEEAVEVADEIIIMNQGRVEQQGTPYDIYRHPETVFVAGFIGESTVIENDGTWKGFENPLPGSKAFVRPEKRGNRHGQGNLAAPCGGEGHRQGRHFPRRQLARRRGGAGPHHFRLPAAGQTAPETGGRGAGADPSAVRIQRQRHGRPRERRQN